eukprot:g2352.t1
MDAWFSLDVAYNAVMRRLQRKEERWFTKGFGDLRTYFEQADAVVGEFRRDGLSRLRCAPKIQWKEMVSTTEGILRDEGEFDSPLAHALPDRSRRARFLYVRAASGSNYPPTRAVIVHMAPTGATSYEERERELARPLVEHGIASLILLPPFSGSRSPHGQPKHYVETVADYLRQSLAIILEGAALVRTLTHGLEGVRPGECSLAPQTTTIGVAGLSWGGAMAACVALVSQRPVACMVGLGSDSPRVMATGAIQWQLDWETLEAERSKASATGVSATRNRAEVEAALVEVLTRVTFKTVLAVAPRPRSIASCVQVAARNDKYVIPSETTQLHASLRGAVCDGALCELRWVDGGHATSFIWQTRIFVPACVDAINAAEAYNGTRERGRAAVAAARTPATDQKILHKCASDAVWACVVVMVALLVGYVYAGTPL